MPLLSFLVATLVATSNFPNELANAEKQISKTINEDELKAHVFRLASKEFAGRRGPGSARTSRHIANLFETMGLAPGFGESYFQPVGNFLADPNEIQNQGYVGRNVAAMIQGSDPKLKDEWIVLSAHFDHLGVGKGGIYFPGADDNASGVAVLLEVAEYFAKSENRPKRSILFVGFDLEESGLLGSRYFAAHPPFPLAKLKTFLTADMLGRSMANLMDDYLFVLGTESSNQLRQIVATTEPAKGLKIGRLGTDLIGTRSDYGPFRDRKIPFLFFSTGQHPDYHKPSDLPDRIDYRRMVRIGNWISQVVVHLANAEETPVWNETPETDIAEAKTIQTLLARVLKSPGIIPLTKQQIRFAGNIQQRLTAIVERGTISESERTWLIWMSRILLATVF